MEFGESPVLVRCPGCALAVRAGGVGAFAIQLGKWLGAHIATTASARGEELVRKLGADLLVDYTREPFEQVLRDYDGALDLIGGAKCAVRASPVSSTRGHR